MSDVVPADGALLNFIERAAKDERFDVAKFETLLRVRRDETHDQARRVFNAAMAACQAEMAPVLRDSANPHVHSKYAKLEAIDRQMRPIYTKHGFSVRFGSAPPPQPGWMRITCTVAHESGYFEENYLDSPVTTTGSQGGRVAMTAVQAVGSVVTYLRRYLLGMVFNIVQADIVGEDDDGSAVTTQKTGQYTAKPPGPPSTQRTEGAWRTWIEKLQVSLVGLDENGVAEMSARPTVKSALQNGPQWVRDEATQLLTEALTAALQAAEQAEADLPTDDAQAP